MWGKAEEKSEGRCLSATPYRSTGLAAYLTTRVSVSG